MNDIPITKDYRIVSDSDQWKILKLAGVDTNKGEQKWVAIKFIDSQERAFQVLRERLSREGNARTLAQLEKHIENVRDILSRAQEKVEI